MRLVYTDDKKETVVSLGGITEPIHIITPVGEVRIGYVDGLKLQAILVTGDRAHETAIKLNGRNLA